MMSGVLVLLMISVGFNIYQLVRNCLIKYDLGRVQARADDLCRDIKRLKGEE